jgi:purine-binding chemotaxis protein CheW
MGQPSRVAWWEKPQSSPPSSVSSRSGRLPRHLPHAPSYIKGMINLRGSILAIIDLAERLGLPGRASNASSVVVVLEAGERMIGLLVDGVSDIVTVTDEMRQIAPETGSAVSRDYVEGPIMRDQQIIGILSVHSFMPKDTAIEAALAAA